MIGQSIAHYTITEKIGEGGMGQVFRATDTKLKREVALKILPESFAQDSQRMGRFTREAEVLASLNHPNIAGVYGLECQGSTHAIAMELVEGETLAARIRKGAIPLEELLKIASQVAEALEAAHEKGIIHRDLKPANVIVRAEGTVKVLDFGLAKATAEGTEASAEMSASPTLSLAATQAGVILGTAAYMSPEQARGRPVDRRSDIWSFGVVLWEMLVGTVPFGGETISDILAAILKESPSSEDLPGRLPPSLVRLLDRCLERDLRHRLQWIGDARLELQEALLEEAQSGRQKEVQAGIRQPWLRLLPWSIAAFALITLLVYWFNSTGPGPGEIPSYVWTLPPPEGSSFVLNQGAPALSPDGRKLVFLASDGDGIRRLWLRHLEELESRVLPGTESAIYPFWSPDGIWIAFFADERLKRIDPAAGQPEEVVALSAPPIGGTWGVDGTILTVAHDGLSVLKIPVGGEVARLTFNRRGGDLFSTPWFLPDGDHYLLTAANTSGLQGIFVGDLETGTLKRLLPTVSNAQFSDGKLIYWEEGRLHAVPFDLTKLEVTGTPFPIAEGVSLATGNSQSNASAATNLLVYLPGPPLGPGELAWLDRSGTELRVLGESADYYRPRLSPEGSQLAVDITSPITGNGDIWRFDTVRGAPLRLISDPGNESHPVWSPEGREFFYSREVDIYRRFASGSGEESAVIADETTRVWPADWSPSGRILLFHRGRGPARSSDLWVLDLDSGETSAWLTSERFIEVDATFSPDGEWVAYSSNESGEFEIYLEDFPDREDKLRISQEGGMGPRWSEGSSELFYYAPGKGLMAVPISRTPEFKTGSPELLFEIKVGSIGGEAFFDVTQDGQRFIVVRFGEQVSFRPLVVRSGWAEMGPQ